MSGLNSWSVTRQCTSLEGPSPFCRLRKPLKTGPGRGKPEKLKNMELELMDLPLSCGVEVCGAELTCFFEALGWTCFLFRSITRSISDKGSISSVR